MFRICLAFVLLGDSVLCHTFSLKPPLVTVMRQATMKEASKGGQPLGCRETLFPLPGSWSCKCEIVKLTTLIKGLAKDLVSHSVDGFDLTVFDSPLRCSLLQGPWLESGETGWRTCSRLGWERNPGSGVRLSHASALGCATTKWIIIKSVKSGNPNILKCKALQMQIVLLQKLITLRPVEFWRTWKGGFSDRHTTSMYL